MKRNRWTLNEVIEYLETKVLEESADENELEMYEDYRWNGKLDKINYTYTIKKIIKQMNEEYSGKE